MDEGYLKYTRIERYINKIKFLGIPMGGTLSAQFLKGEKRGIQPSIMVSTRILLGQVLWVLLSIFRRKTFIMNTRVIGTWIADKNHYRNMMFPLIDHFNKDITIICNLDIKNIDQLQNANFVSRRETFITPLNYVPYLIRFILVILFAFITKRKRLNFNIKELYYYGIQLFHQGRIIAFYDNQFKRQKNQVRLVITEYDRNPFAAPLVLAAKKHGIKTITLVHGLIEAKVFTPVLADYIFCLGEIQKNQLAKQRVPGEKIRVTGTTIIPTFKELERRKKQKDSVLRICLGIQNIKKEHLNAMINTVIETVSDKGFVELIIKLHPVQEKKNFIHLEQQYKNIKVISSNEIDNIDLFAKIDLLIINYSALGFEAMYQKVPVVLMKTQKGETSLVDLIAKWSTLPVFETSGELHSILSRIMTDSKYLDDLSKTGKAFADKYFYATGIEAAQNIINGLTEVANLKDQDLAYTRNI
ncbi:MAG: CDP-glycerol glycerophosphotransferase family protein [Bacteroidales bacterium]|nr:CDP-glycerol glycerophosphotransferase family protein [Bacteroidales bacterium]